MKLTLTKHVLSLSVLDKHRTNKRLAESSQPPQIELETDPTQANQANQTPNHRNTFLHISSTSPGPLHFRNGMANWQSHASALLFYYSSTRPTNHICCSIIERFNLLYFSPTFSLWPSALPSSHLKVGLRKECALNITSRHKALLPAILSGHPSHPCPAVALVQLDHLQLLTLLHWNTSFARC